MHKLEIYMHNWYNRYEQVLPPAPTLEEMQHDRKIKAERLISARAEAKLRAQKKSAKNVKRATR